MYFIVKNEFLPEIYVFNYAQNKGAPINRVIGFRLIFDTHSPNPPRDRFKVATTPPLLGSRNLGTPLICLKETRLFQI